MSFGKLGAMGRGFGHLGALGSSGSIPGYSNFTGLNLTKWQVAEAARLAGTRNSIIAAIGDSTVAGLGAGSTGGGDVNAIANSWPNQLAGLLSGASASSMWASHAQAFGFDARLAATGGWTRTGADSSAGGAMWQSPSAGRLSFTPTNQVDTFVIRYPTIAAGGLGTMNVSIDAGATTLINEGLATGYSSQTFTTTLGAHTFNIDWVSGAAYVGAIYAYNSASKEISVFNMGWSSSKISNWINSGNAWNPYNALATIAADLYLIDLTINDAVGATNLATYSTSMGLLIDQCKTVGSVILMSGNPVDPVPNACPLATQLTYVNAMKALSVSKNVPMIDVFTLWGGTYAGPLANGWMFGDTVHPKTLGYTQIAGYVQRALATGFVSR